MSETDEVFTTVEELATAAASAYRKMEAAGELIKAGDSSIDTIIDLKAAVERWSLLTTELGRQLRLVRALEEEAS